MADSDQSKRTWVFMGPWWGVLKAHNVTTSMDASGIRGLRISLAPTDANTASTDVVQRCCALRDALELVFLQSIVDYGSFVVGLVNQAGLLEQYAMGKLLREIGELRRHIDARYIHQCRKPTMMLWVRTAITTLLTPRQLHERDRAFVDARQQLLAAAAPGDVNMTVKISFDLAPGDDTGMFELANFVCTALPPPAEYPFGQAVLDIRVSTKEQKLADIATCLNDRHKRMRLGWARLDALEDVEEVPYGDLLAAYFQPEGLSQPADDPEYMSPRASIDTATCPRYQLVTQLCSAVMSAQGVESLVLDWTPEGGQPGLPRFWNSRSNQVRFMRWIVLSLFSNLARHSIHQLHLKKFHVSIDDMDDLEAFLRRPGDKQLIALRRGLRCGDERTHDEEGEVMSPREQIFLAEGTTLWLDAFFTTRHEATRESKTAILRRGYWADVMVDGVGDANHYDLLVPGYGWCKVRRADAQNHRVLDQAPDVDRLVTHGITSLTLTWV